jgi:glycosyltransferase domain-containing protein
MTDQLTIVLTLKDRAAFTRRWMRYMNDIGCAFPILIADGGSDREIEARLRVPENYPRLRYVYVRYPADAEYTDYYRKLADAIDRVQTPYTLLADNDDFFLLDAAGELLQFLAEHPDYVSCGGWRIVLRLLSGATLSGGDSASRYEARVDLRPKTIAAATPIDRIRYFLGNVRRLYLWSSWYAIHRTDALAQATGIARTHPFRDPVAHELHVHIAMLLRGRVGQIDRPWFVNQAGTSQTTAALEAAGSVAARFAASGALEDLKRSLAPIDSHLAAADRHRLDVAIDEWLAVESGPSFGAPETRPISLPALEPYILNA